MAFGSFVGRIETVESPIELIPVLWKLDVSTFVENLQFPIPEVDLFG